MNFKDHIISDHKIMLGKPVIKGTRITVEIILRKLSEGATIIELKKSYPHLSENDIYAAIEYAAEVISNETLIEVTK